LIVEAVSFSVAGATGDGLMTFLSSFACESPSKKGPNRPVVALPIGCAAARSLFLTEPAIISEPSALNESFHAKRFQLMWGGGRDGVGITKLRRCNGRAETAALICHSEGKRFMQVGWEPALELPQEQMR
jgi:hypothetical protein